MTHVNVVFLPLSVFGGFTYDLSEMELRKPYED